MLQKIEKKIIFFAIKINADFAKAADDGCKKKKLTRHHSIESCQCDGKESLKIHMIVKNLCLRMRAQFEMPLVIKQ